MPSILEQKFKITFTVPRKHESAVQKYLEENVGGRTYYLHSKVGGKHWAIERNFHNNNVSISLDDESLASFITLKYV